jgi:hypothetical protein
VPGFRVCGRGRGSRFPSGMTKEQRRMRGFFLFGFAQGQNDKREVRAEAEAIRELQREELGLKGSSRHGGSRASGFLRQAQTGPSRSNDALRMAARTESALTTRTEWRQEKKQIPFGNDKGKSARCAIAHVRCDETAPDMGHPGSGKTTEQRAVRDSPRQVR